MSRKCSRQTPKRCGAVCRSRRRVGCPDLAQGNHAGDFDCPPLQMPPVRIITVTDADLEQFARSGAGVPQAGLGFFQWQCKAVGLRRAQGAFLLATNADNLWSPKLLRFLSMTPHLRDRPCAAGKRAGCSVTEVALRRKCCGGRSCPDVSGTSFAASAGRVCPWVDPEVPTCLPLEACLSSETC